MTSTFEISYKRDDCHYEKILLQMSVIFGDDYRDSTQEDSWVGEDESLKTINDPHLQIVQCRHIWADLASSWAWSACKLYYSSKAAYALTNK